MTRIFFDHIEEKMNELRFFHKALEETHERHLAHVRTLRRPFDDQGKPIARYFQYFLSAYLSAHRAVRYYVTRVSGKVALAKEWRAGIDCNVALRALHHLRDVEVHDETLNMSSSVRLTEMQTNPLLHASGLMLDERSLRGIKRLANHPELLEYLTSKSVIEIARDGVDHLEQIVSEGRQRGYLAPQPLSGY